MPHKTPWGGEFDSEVSVTHPYKISGRQVNCWQHSKKGSKKHIKIPGSINRDYLYNNCLIPLLADIIGLKMRMIT
jgi:hypothetical protein